MPELKPFFAIDVFPKGGVQKKGESVVHFDDYDVDGNGKITIKELKEYFKDSFLTEEKIEVFFTILLVHIIEAF